jgi:hypothetical protein
VPGVVSVPDQTPLHQDLDKQRARGRDDLEAEHAVALEGAHSGQLHRGNLFLFTKSVAKDI